MMKLQRIYITLVALILALAGCDKLIYEQETDGEPTVYLSVSTRAAHTNGQESINEDGADYEDRVHDLAMLIFNTGSGDKVAHYFGENLGSGTSTYAFTAELTAGGQYDFYFVANMPNLKTDLQSIASRTEMNNYMNAVHDLEANLYLSAEEEKGFPMARVYLNQTVLPGGTIYQPQPFRPVVGGVTEDNVRLIRVVAKLEVSLIGTDLDIKDIYFRNANRHFYLVDPSVTPPSAYFNDNSTNVPLKKIDDNTYIYYIPETIITSATWNDTGNNQPINYFTIETNSGETYNIPIISNETSITTDYLAKATGNFTGFTPQYTIHRNDHYKYVIRNLEKIEIIYIVNQWELVNKALYMGYGYNVEVEGTKVSINNTVEACDPYHVRLETVGSITFSDGDTQKDFTDYDPDASISFELSEEPPVGYGDYLRVYFIDVDTTTDTPVHTFSK